MLCHYPRVSGDTRQVSASTSELAGPQQRTRPAGTLLNVSALGTGRALRSALGAGGGDALDDLALTEEEHDDHRHGGDDAGGDDDLPVPLAAEAELVEQRLQARAAP